MQQSERSPAQPSYILRGHKAQVHALLFARGNTRLFSGDADGIVISWDLVTKRAKAVWRAHDGGILGLSAWGDEKLISHGRDGKVKVWKLGAGEEEGMDSELPVELGEDGKGAWNDPWLLHSLKIHTLNFCAFAMCDDARNESSEGILIATPAANEGATVVHQLPSEDLLYLVPPAEAGKTGMVMALRIAFVNGALLLITGYESGLTSVQRLKSNAEKLWETITACKPHTQPILSLDVDLSASIYFTSSADAVVAKASLEAREEKRPLQMVQTKHSGQQSLVIRDDGKILATAGWDGRMRIYSTKQLSQVAVLKWHNEGCYAAAFAKVFDSGDASNEGTHEISNRSTATEPTTVARRNEVRSMLPRTQRQKRQSKVTSTHWLAAGSKDGKISLWDIF